MPVSFYSSNLERCKRGKLWLQNHLSIYNGCVFFPAFFLHILLTLFFPFYEVNIIRNVHGSLFKKKNSLFLSGTAKAQKITPIISLPQQDHSPGQLHPQVLLLITISNQETAVMQSRGRTCVCMFVLVITAEPACAVPV